MSKATRTRTVWLNALRSLMHAYCITQDTFDLTSMSLPELEHAALAPRRFIELLKARPGDRYLLSPTQIRILPSRLTRREQKTYGMSSRGENHDFRVAPGGRYLIVISRHSPLGQDGNGYLFTLWDIGIGQELEMKVRGRMVWPQVEDCTLLDLYFDTGRSEPGTGLLYFAFSCKNSNGVYVCAIS